MKKLITLGGLLIATLVAHGQAFESRSFLNCRSLLITNNINVTNLTSSVSRGTNITSTIFTNLSGVQIITSNGYNDKLNLLKVVPLFVDRPGAMITTAGATNACIFIRTAAGLSGANATNSVTFVFAAIPSNQGTNSVANTSPNSILESTATADLFTIVTTANTAQPQSFRIGFPYNQIVGSYGLELRSISTTATQVGSDIWVLECSYNGFVP